MLNFKDINNKSNINNNKSYNQIFSKQGQKIMKKKEGFDNKVDITLVNNHKLNSKNIQIQNKAILNQTDEDDDFCINNSEYMYNIPGPNICISKRYVIL
jgi:hypothetical protein